MKKRKICEKVLQSDTWNKNEEDDENYIGDKFEDDN